MLQLNKSGFNKIKFPLLIGFLVIGFFLFRLLTPEAVVAQEGQSATHCRPSPDPAFQSRRAACAPSIQSGPAPGSSANRDART